MHYPRRLFGLGLVVLASLFAPATGRAEGEAPPPAAPVDDRVRFTATFRYAGDAREEAARRAAIDKAVDSLFFAIRGIARSRLSNGTKIDPSVSFAFPPGKILVRLPGSTDAISPDNGAAVDYVDDGEKSKLSQRLTAGRLAQLYAADDGRRVNEWSLSADGTTLQLRVTVSSPKLSAPVIYTLTYKKVA
jgi:hypothetical protein